MIEASVRTPEKFPGKPPSPAETGRLLKLVALLRALTPSEAVALLKERRPPERLDTLAEAVGLPLAECEQRLAGVAFQLGEGLRLVGDP
jgi:hypothetical protein